jgi:type I site-specific restriction-modification system R (restriction) subunit
MPSSSVADKATAPIYYESRIAKLALNASELPKIDEEFDEITEGEEFSKKEKLKTKWAALEALVGDPKRIGLIAADLVAHFEKRVEAMERKPLNKGIFNCRYRGVLTVSAKRKTACPMVWKALGAKSQGAHPIFF